MCEYVEDTNNMIFQVYNEFYDFLNSVYYYHVIKIKGMQRLFLDSMRLHARVITEFFSNNKNKGSDDLIYTDLIIIDDDLSVNLSTKMRKFVNKNTAHISKKRGTLPFENNEFIGLLKELFVKIECFIDNCNNSLKSEYQSDYQNEDVTVLKELISMRLVEVSELVCS